LYLTLLISVSFDGEVRNFATSKTSHSKCCLHVTIVTDCKLWRSCQMAYILNHQDHWFSLRRVGNLADPDSGHWFNLNSFLSEPEWVSKLYLGMVLSQAEDEGYSVFAVLPYHQDANEPMVLPHTEVDDIAATLPEPTSGNIGTRISTSRVRPVPDASSLKPSDPPAGFEDEDMELQAALQASLSGADSFDYSAFGQGTVIRPAAGFPPPPPAISSVQGSESAFEDPIAASMARNLARNKAMMQRMQREQEMALREGYQEEIERNFGDESSRRFSRTNTNNDEEDEEAIQKAIEETRPDESGNVLGRDVSNDDGMWRQSVPGDRVYDDEDSELQAALKASLEMLPDDFVIPTTPPRSPIAGPSPSSVRMESNVSTTVEMSSEPEPPKAELDAEEIRRRRLARFGGGQ